MLNLGQIVRLLVFSVLLLQTGALHAQKLETKTKIADGKISIKWLPSNYFALRKMSEGAVVQRIEVSENTNLKALNYSQGITWKIDALQERYDALQESDSTQANYKAILEPVVDWVADKERQNFALGTNVILNVTDPGAQFVLGNILEDSTVDPAKKYAYKIKVTGVPAAYVFVDPAQKTEHPKIKASVLLDNRKSVVVSWDYTAIQETSFAFDIMHAVSDTLLCSPLFDQPYLPFTTNGYVSDSTSVRDENAVKGKRHFYKVIGRDAFGKQTLHSDWHSVYIPNRIEAYPTIDSVSAENTIRHISGSISPSQNANITTVALLQSRERASGYKLLEQKPYMNDSLLSFSTEVSKETGDAYYYQVALINEDDTVRSQPYYFFTLDQEPPGAPERVKISIDSSGIATLNWTAPKDNDIEGYRIFRANTKSEEFIEQTTKLQHTHTFKDTLALNSLTSEVYYYVTAVDQNFNQGACSDTVLGLKPDTIAPMPSLIRSVSATDFGIALEFIASTSTDVAQTTLYRDGILVCEVDSIYNDTTVTAGMHHKYHLETQDESGNRSRSKTIEQKYEPGYRDAAELNAEVILTENHVKLTWGIPTKDVYDIRTHKAKSDEKMRLWKTLHDPDQTSITDTWISIGESYKYVLIYTTQEGIQSLKSEVTVQY